MEVRNKNQKFGILTVIDQKPHQQTLRPQKMSTKVFRKKHGVNLRPPSSAQIRRSIEKSAKNVPACTLAQAFPPIKIQ